MLISDGGGRRRGCEDEFDASIRDQSSGADMKGASASGRSKRGGTGSDDRRNRD